MLVVKFYPLDYDEIFSYIKQDYYWLKKFILELF